MSLVQTVSALNEDVLASLFNNYICAIRVPNFLAPEHEKLADWIYYSHELEDYKHELYEEGNPEVAHFAGAVSRVGFPFNLTYGEPPDSEVRKQYYAEAR